MRYSSWVPGVTSPVPTGGPVSPSEALMLSLRCPTTYPPEKSTKSRPTYYGPRRVALYEQLHHTRLILSKVAACGTSLVLFSFPFILAYSGLN